MMSDKETGLLELELPEGREHPEVEFPDVEVRGDEAVIRTGDRENPQQRTVKLPRTIWG